MAIPRWVEWNYTAPGRPQPEPTFEPAQPYSRPGNLPRRLTPPMQRDTEGAAILLVTSSNYQR